MIKIIVKIYGTRGEVLDSDRMENLAWINRIVGFD